MSLQDQNRDRDGPKREDSALAGEFALGLLEGEERAAAERHRRMNASCTASSARS